ncbi:hypothetical protein [Arthrobacter sp. SLBN-100]|uniref:hypothetical protein n=1 Tax=Arthrobacter sp. SLBN-100 TaxID=2768450 RepID=UPI00114F5924|nr:hypothetical protein [Arthrobacter sp. SLBN-100]
MHAKWDLRFSRIVPLSIDGEGVQQFRCEFRLPFHTMHGTGTSLGNRDRSDGQSTSVLKFDTFDPLSPIGRGSGYWRYIPTKAGLRFITGYNYSPGMGALGKLMDSWLFRPALGWATAVSFDRLRMWADFDLDPKASRNRWFMDAVARAVGIVTAALLLRAAVEKRNATAAIACLAVAGASCLVPPHRTVPRAGRCLRQAPDLRSWHAPSALATLAAPAGRDGVSFRAKGGDGVDF